MDSVAPGGEGDMRKTFTIGIALVVALIGMYAHGDVVVSEQAECNHFITVETNVEAGLPGLVCTNKQEFPFALVNVAIYDEGCYTNSFVVDGLEIDWTRMYKGNVVTTNGFDEVETNYYPTVTNISYAYYTNNLATNCTTNVHSEVYAPNKSEGYQLAESYYVGVGDAIRFNWSYTNNSRRLRFTGIR